MKRFILISIVLSAIAWIAYSSYELWINVDNTVNPENVFCNEDQSILLINKFEETKDANYFEAIKGNPLALTLPALDSLPYQGLKIYASGNRAIIIFEKDSKWKSAEAAHINSFFKLKDVTYKFEGRHLMISKDYQYCENKLTKNLLLEGDKKASANFWVNLGQQWKRTDVYNLSKGFFEYRSSEPNAVYGEAVKDIPIFSSVIPHSSSSYLFKERFFAASKDSIFKDGPMNLWVDKGYVTIDYEGHHILVSDYRSQQTPSLILIEQSKNEDSVLVLEDMHSFSGFQLTHDFPLKEKSRFYVIEIEDKVLFIESKSIARKILVNYQLGKTLALSPDRQEQFFGGLPSHVNMRDISMDKKASLTWKNNLMFEVNTQPPSEQLNIADKTTWSTSVKHETYKLVPITDHLRNGTSVLSHDQSGKYELVSPNGKTLWQGDVKSPIQGEVMVVDVFNNNKHQFLFRTKRQIHLIDLNGNDVGGFPYQSEHDLTTGISEFVWNGTKRFLIGNQQGEIIMLNSAGLELNIIQVGKEGIVSTPYALNIKGNLRVWAVNADFQQYLGYLETPAKAQLIGKTTVQHAIKYKGRVITYFQKDGKVYSQVSDIKGVENKDARLIDNGQLFKVNAEYFIISNGNNFKVFNHDNEILYSKQLPFNEVGTFDYHSASKTSVVFDYLQNKIHAFNKLGETLEGFPKEGRNKTISYFNKNDNTLYTYTIIAQSIICYKNKY
ncbi:hypothetical protein [Brumimicrobium sp.]|uniref:hypothetical protein n=1 Tax=Brumimicrobium sp. TaxID=2029867 RepID=UPI003A94D698